MTLSVREWRRGTPGRVSWSTSPTAAMALSFFDSPSGASTESRGSPTHSIDEGGEEEECDDGDDDEEEEEECDDGDEGVPAVSRWR